ncbi:hypothetical protein [Thiohalomonas denitrificans]|nr:hypothetical protein [Thiohalomonas denitrificans]
MEKMAELLFMILPALLAAAGLTGLGLGAALLMFPDQIGKWGKRLETPFTSERFIYRHNRFFGLFLLAGGAFALLKIGASIAAGYRAHLAGGPVFESLMDASLIFLLLGNLGAMMIGAIVWIRPSHLKGWEIHVNHWVSTRRSPPDQAPLASRIDRHVLVFPRTAGAFFILAGLYLLASATMMNFA